MISDKNKAKIPPKTIIRQSAENMNDLKSKKYGVSPNDVEKNHYLVNGLKHYSILKEQNDQKNISDRFDKYDQKVLVLAERINKKSAPGKFYKQTVQSISIYFYFNKKKLYLQ